MNWLPQTAGERLLASALLALAAHLAAYLLLDAMPAAQQNRVGLHVRLAPVAAGKAAPGLAPRAVPVPLPASSVPASGSAPPAVPTSSPLGQLPADASTIAASGAPTELPSAQDASLSLARYYLASELDALAEPLQPVVLPPTDIELADDAVVEVYIDYQGWVQRVVVPASLDAEYALQVEAAFMNARFAPALKDGLAVNSLKRIALLAEGL